MGILNAQTLNLKVGGIDESIDSKQLPPGYLLTCQNMQMLKTGKLGKRHGFTALTTTGLTTPFRGMFSSGSELCLIAKDRLFAFNTANSTWRRAGYISQFSGKENAVARGGRSHSQCDQISHAGMTVYAQRWEYQTAIQTTGAPYAGLRSGITAQLKTDSNETQIASEILVDYTGTTDPPIGVRAAIFSNTTGGLIYTHGDIVNAATAATITIFTATLASAVSFSAATALVPNVNDVYKPVNDRTRKFDNFLVKEATVGVCTQYNWVLAYVNSTRGIVVSLYDAINRQQTLTIAPGGGAPPTWESVSVCESPTKIYVMGWDSNGLQVYVGRIDKATWAVDIAMTALTVALVGARNFGIAYFDSAVHTVFTEEATTTATSGVSDDRIQYHKLTTALVTSNNLLWWNMANCSKPYMDSELGYPIFDARTSQNPQYTNLGISPTVSYIDEVPFTTCGVVLSANTAMGNNAGIAAVHDVGMNISGMRIVGGTYFELEWETRSLGSANTVSADSNGDIRFSVTTMQYSAYNTTERYGSDEVILRADDYVLTSSISRNAAVIGGGFVSWYDGQNVCELGFMSAPHVNIIATPAAASGLSGNYRYNYVWEYVDSGGNVHRSSPGIGTPDVAVALNDNVELTFRTLNPSHRDGRNVSVQVYRGDALGGQFERITEPTRLVKNDSANYALPIYVDFGQAQRDVLYTSTNEVEAVIPEGAQVVRVIGDRLWLAGLLRGERILYSKKIYRGSAQAPYVPEVNDTFGFTIPDASRVTAIGQLNDNVVIFTEKQVYLVAGQGPDDTGSGSQFSQLTPLASDGGCIDARSVVSYPEGMFFQSARGIYHIDRSNNINYKGAAVQDTLVTYPIITSAVVVPEANQVRFTCIASTEAKATGAILVYDYKLGVWLGTWKIVPSSGLFAPVCACVHGGVYYVGTLAGKIYYEDISTYMDDTTSWQTAKVTFPWVQAAQQSGFQRIRHIIPLMERVGVANVKVSVHNNFDSTTPAQNPRTWTNAELAALPKAPIIELDFHVTAQKCNAFSVTIEDADPTPTATTGNSFELSGVRCEFGIKKGPVKFTLAQRR